MIALELKLDLGGVFAALDELETGARERAARSAINKTLAKAKTNMIRVISREFNVSAGYVRERLKVAGSVFAGGRAMVSGTLSASGKNKHSRSANVIAFMEKSVSLAQAKKRAKAGTLDQLHFQIKRGGKRVVIPGAFIGNQGRTVFKRQGKGRLPIEAVQTIDVPQMFNTQRLNSVVVKAILEDFPGIYQHELQFFIERFNQRGAR